MEKLIPTPEPIPELMDVLDRHSTSYYHKPKYGVVGIAFFKHSGFKVGIFAMAESEFQAHLIRKELRKACEKESALVKRTEFHAIPEIDLREVHQSVTEYKAKAK